MKLATFEIPTPAGPLRRIGAAVDGRLIDLAAAYAGHLDRTDPGCDAQRLASFLFPPDMALFLGSGALGRSAASRAVDEAGRSDEALGARTRYTLDEVRLQAPLARPRVLRDFLTFEGHMKQAFKALGKTDPISPLWYEVPAYYKGDPDTVVGPEAEVPVPRYCEKFDFELELAMVVGRRGKNIAKADAPGYIAGYTIWNDFSARDQQMKEGPLGMGPSKAKDSDELDVENLRMIARVNGDVWTNSTSAGRQFSFPDLIVHVSQSETIYPGELWGSGTVTGGSGLELGRWLHPGDVVELEIEGIGVLRNKIVS
jgi:2-keto-4-pentenoate hydratase/2-oxohepta-3-ene-1,7-dioic acid hydratase in catechol pathway